MWLCLTARIRLLQREFIRFKDFLVKELSAVALKFRLACRRLAVYVLRTHRRLTPDNRSPEAMTVYFRVVAARKTKSA
jgi:hypothetical protein